MHFEGEVKEMKLSTPDVCISGRRVRRADLGLVYLG